MANDYEILTGVRVIELTTYVAAPSSGRMLADWGAEVIKVEAAPKGDVVRFVVPLPVLRATPDEPVCFEQCNANKKSVVVDLKTPEGVEIMHKLLATADVLLTNTRTAALKKLGMDYDALAPKYPRLIHAQLSGYGEVGPLAEEPGFDNVSFWALGGGMVAFMEKDTAPIIPPTAFGDQAIACTMAGAVCAALFKQQRTGLGSKIVVSLFGQAVWDMATPLLATQCGEDVYPKTRLDTTPLNNTYLCKDGRWIMICCHEYDRYFPRFMRIIGREDLLSDPEVNNYKLSKNGRARVIAALSEGFAGFERDELDALLTKEDIPHAVLANIDELFTSEQVLANNFLREFELPSGRKIMEAVSPVKFGGPDLPPRKSAPLLGQHTSELLKEIGYDEDRIRELKEAGVIVETLSL
jgi:crotonobetainyl-CoA:carnitine CoA-transferase CaiB-like acyl-CoA transferase